MFSAKEILDIAVKLEKNGENVYRQCLEKMSDEKLKCLLTWIIEEEIKHATWFADLQNEESHKVNQIFKEEIPMDMFADVIGEQAFSLAEVDFSNIKSMDDLINTFIEFEKDTLLFYEMLLPFLLDEDAKTFLNDIIKEEKNHIDRLLAVKTDEICNGRME